MASVGRPALKAEQAKAIEMLVQGGYTQREIADAVGVTQTTISTWKNKDDKFKDALHERQLTFLGDAVPKAMKTMIDLLDSKSDYVRFQAADNILTRMGFDPVDRQEVSVELPTFVDDIKDVDEDEE